MVAVVATEGSHAQRTPQTACQKLPHALRLPTVPAGRAGLEHKHPTYRLYSLQPAPQLPVFSLQALAAAAAVSSSCSQAPRPAPFPAPTVAAAGALIILVLIAGSRFWHAIGIELQVALQGQRSK